MAIVLCETPDFRIEYDYRGFHRFGQVAVFKHCEHDGGINWQYAYELCQRNKDGLTREGMKFIDRCDWSYENAGIYSVEENDVLESMNYHTDAGTPLRNIPCMLIEDYDFIVKREERASKETNEYFEELRGLCH